jgi:hypothetical protein
MDDQEIRTLLSRLARPHASGGQAVERAAILAAGAEFPAILVWINAHAGQPETSRARATSGGLHSSRMNDGAGAADRQPPQRYVLPSGTFG